MLNAKRQKCGQNERQPIRFSLCSARRAYASWQKLYRWKGVTKAEASLAFGRPVTQAVLTSFRAFVASDLKSQISNLEIPFQDRVATAGGT